MRPIPEETWTSHTRHYCPPISTFLVGGVKVDPWREGKKDKCFGLKGNWSRVEVRDRGQRTETKEITPKYEFRHRLEVKVLVRGRDLEPRWDRNGNKSRDEIWEDRTVGEVIRVEGSWSVEGIGKGSWTRVRTGVDYTRGSRTSWPRPSRGVGRYTFGLPTAQSSTPGSSRFLGKEKVLRMVYVFSQGYRNGLSFY